MLARLVYHVLQTADYYHHPNLGEFDWSGRFCVDWQTEEIEKLPEREQILDYLGDVQIKVNRWIESHRGTGLLALDEVFHQESMCHLDRTLYVLRHTHQHIGELFSILRAKNFPRPRWR